MTTDPKQALLARAASIQSKIAATVLWKYTDEDGKDFYLSDKKVGTLKSPYTGKSFTAKPERSSLSDVGKELKEDDAKVKGALWKYSDDEGGTFYLPERVTGTVRSPVTGKSFTAHGEKMNFGEINKAEKTAAASTVLWKYVGGDGMIFYLPEKVVGMVRDPFSGSTFPGHPVRVNLTTVAKELRAQGNRTNAIWQYTDGDGQNFYMAIRRKGSMKSPYTGKSFIADPQRLALGEVGEQSESVLDPRQSELQELQALLAAKGYDPKDAIILQAEGMGPFELVERLKEPDGLEKSHALVKLASTEVTASLTSAEKKVVDAFYEKRPAHGGMLTTDGKELEKNGIGGKNVAKWEGDKIVVSPDRPMVKNDEEILRYMKKSIPANTLAPHPFFRKSSALAEELLTVGDEHPAITAVSKAFNDVLAALGDVQNRVTNLKAAGEGSIDYPTLLLAGFQPKVRKLAEVAAIVSKQLEDRLA
jgi:hypothetical protein